MSATASATSWRALGPHVRPHRRVLAVGAALGLLGSGAALAQPLAAQSVIEALQERESVLTPIVVLSALVVLGALLTGTYLLLLERTAERIVLRARLGLAARMLRLRVPAIDRQSPGDLLTRMTSDTTLLRAAASNGVVQLVNGAVGLLGAIVLMAVVDWVLLLVTLGVLGTIAFGVLVLLPRVSRATERGQAAVGEIGSVLERALAAVRTVKASGAEARETAAIDAAARRSYDAGLELARHQAVLGVATGLAIQVSFLAVLGVGGARVADGAMDVAALVAFLLYLFSLAPPVAGPVQAGIELQAGLGALARLDATEQLPVEDDVETPADGVLESAIAAGPAPGVPLISFARVAFAYGDERAPVLHDVSFDVPEGGQTALVGPSGAGKTTLFALLQRFYEPTGGAVLLGGRDVSTIPRGTLRRSIGSVEQDAPVLAGTLRDNLLYGAPGASGAELAEVVAETRLEELVAQLPEGLDSEIASRGSSLSGGERQRIAIARALLRRPRILLLDEATSQLDARNEMALRDTIARAARRCTVLVIAHRLSTVVAADQIVVLDAGHVRAVGTHAELVERDTLYRELAMTQLLASPAG